MRHSAVVALAPERVARLDRHPRPGPGSAGAAECRTQAGDRAAGCAAPAGGRKTARHRAPTISPGRPARRRPPARTARATRRRIRCPAARAPRSRARTRRRRTRRRSSTAAGMWPARRPTARPCRRNSPSATTPSISVPIMAMAALALQRRAEASDRGRASQAANSPVQTTNAKPAEELPWTVTVHDLRHPANDPALAKMKYRARAGPHPADRADEPDRDRRDQELKRLHYRGRGFQPPCMPGLPVVERGPGDEPGR